jgi:hypothetical protein
VIWSLPVRWLRGLAGALRRWAGTVTEGRARWRRHDGRLGAAVFTVHVPALPPAEPGEPPDVRAALEAARARLVSGAPLAALADAARLGAVIHARIEDGSEERRPGLIVVAPADPPALG